MKIVIHVPMWKRPILTNYIFRYYNRLQDMLRPEIELKLLAIGSEGDKSRLIAERNGFEYIEYNNRPLNKKINAAVQQSRQYEPDMLIAVGTDDIISANYFRNIEPQSDAVIGFRDLYFLDFHTKRLGYWPGYEGSREGEPVGQGRCFSRKILEKCNWEPWPQDKEEMGILDFNCRIKMFSLGIKMKAFKMEEFGCFAMSVKMENNIISWNSFKYEEIIKDEKLETIFKLYGISDIFDLNDSIIR